MVVNKVFGFEGLLSSKPVTHNTDSKDTLYIVQNFSYKSNTSNGYQIYAN